MKKKRALWRFHFVVPTAAALERLRKLASDKAVRYSHFERPGGLTEDHEFVLDGSAPSLLVQLMELACIPGRRIVPPWPVSEAGILQDFLTRRRDGQK